MMTHDEMIAVIAHHKNGGNVQCSRKGGMATGETRDWREREVPAWNFHDFDYRARPEPLVIWAEIMPDGDPIFCGQHKFKPTHGGTLKKFMEVTE